MNIVIDHILSKKTIENIEGFEDFTDEMQRRVLSNPDNLQPMYSSYSQSKGAKDLTKGDQFVTLPDGSSVSSEYQVWLKERQASITRVIEIEIGDLISQGYIR